MSVLSLSPDFLSMSIVCAVRPLFALLFCVICVFCLLVVFVKLPVPVQVIDWKDSSRNDLECVDGDIKPYSLTHSLTY